MKSCAPYIYKNISKSNVWWPKKLFALEQRRYECGPELLTMLLANLNLYKFTEGLIHGFDAFAL